MADRIIKGDSGNDVVIQNNAGSRKIEVTNSGDVEVTGDVKTTTVKATNLKANDGTAGLVVADSTGEVTSEGGLKASDVKTTNLKANDGTAGLQIADSTGRLTVTETNPSITLGSNCNFPLGNIKKIYSKTFTGDLTANSTTKVIDTTNQITIPNVSNGDFLYITAIGGNVTPNTSGVGSNVRCSITAGGVTFRGVDFYSNPVVNVPISIARLVTISSDASNYVVARSVEGSSSVGNVVWGSGSFNPVSLTVFHIGSGAISDVSNT